jgi:predicted CoA-binding protein
MNDLRTAIDDFLAQDTLAIVGVSRKKSKFGSMAYRSLKKKGYRLFGVNPGLTVIDGDPCYPSLEALPEPVGGVLIILPPEKTELVAHEAAEAGIHRIWIQQGAESEAAVQFCNERDLSVVAGECILLHADPVRGIHRLHRWIARLMGRLAF